MVDVSDFGDGTDREHRPDAENRNWRIWHVFKLPCTFLVQRFDLSFEWAYGGYRYG